MMGLGKDDSDTPNMAIFDINSFDSWELNLP